MNNSIPLSCNIECKFSSITVSKEADKAIFFKYSGEISRQIIFYGNEQKNEEIKKENIGF